MYHFDTHKIDIFDTSVKVPTRLASAYKFWHYSFSYNTSKHVIEREFERFGRLQKVELVCDPSGYSRGFGFVTYDHQEVWKTQKNVTSYTQTVELNTVYSKPLIN